MKANPGKVRYGSTGVGAIVHLGVATLEAATGVKAVHVPYTGIAPVYNDLVAGTIDFTMGAVPPFPDTLKVVAAIGTKRNSAYPEIPTLEESGYKNAGWSGWFGLIAPPQLPKPIADRLIAELGEVMKDPEAIAKFNGVKIAPETNPLIGDEFKKQVADEYKNWKTVVDREQIVIQQ
jgi:tripartite-type tricarboxylate transporter receptor subunit TctC